MLSVAQFLCATYHHRKGYTASTCVSEVFHHYGCLLRVYLQLLMIFFTI